MFSTLLQMITMANRVRQRGKSPFFASIVKVVTLSIAIGNGAILIAIMVLLGFQREIKRKLTAFSGDFVITQYSATAAPYEPPPMEAKEIKAVWAHLPHVIEQILPFTQKVFLVHTAAGMEGLLCRGLDAMQEAVVDYIVAGRSPTLGKDHYSNEVVISRGIAQRLSIDVGDSLRVHTILPMARFRKLKVVGIYCTYLNAIDDQVIFGDMRLIQRLNNWAGKAVSGYTIFLKEDVQANKAVRNAILAHLDDHLRLTATKQQYAAFYDWLTVIQTNTIIFITCILLVGGFTMVATLMIQLIERKGMMRLLKALGAQDWQLYVMVMWNGLYTLLHGMVYGNLLGIGLSFLQKHYKLVTLDPQLYYIHHLPIYWNGRLILWSNLSILTILFATSYVTIRLLKIEPQKGL